MVGSRGLRPFDSIAAQMQFLLDLYGSKLEIVSGGAHGVDKTVEVVANELGVYTDIFRVSNAEWDEFGKEAGIMRNKKMIATVERVYAWWDGKSRGTQQAIRFAQNRMMPVFVTEIR